MYKGYKTYRGYINAKLHALSIVICGSREVLDNEICEILKKRMSLQNLTPPADLGKLSTSLLGDTEATDLYHKLINVAQAVKKNEAKAKEIIGTDDAMSDGQRKSIIKLCLYDMKWKPGSTFNYILKTLPDLREKMTGLQIKQCDLRKLYSLMTKEDANVVIKRLDKIIEHNRINKSLDAAKEGVMHEK